MTKTIVLTGWQSGLGKLILRNFRQQTDAVFNLKTPEIDLSKPDEIEDFGERMGEGKWGVDILINCAGVNEIDYIEDLTAERFDHIMAVNARSHFLMTKALLPIMKGGTVLNIISNASRIAMTSSLAYNASKAAAEMITKQMARELFPRHGITVFGLSPNKMHSTGMTEYIDRRVQETRGWTPQQAKDYQLQGLPIKEETNPEVVAEFVNFLLRNKENHRYLHGCILPYGGPTGV